MHEPPLETNSEGSVFGGVSVLYSVNLCGKAISFPSSVIVDFLLSRAGPLLLGIALEISSFFCPVIQLGRFDVVMHWFALNTKHLPSQATVLIKDIHVSRASAVGAKYKLTFWLYMECRSRGM